MSGSELTLLRVSGVQRKPVPDQLRFSAAVTLHGLAGFGAGVQPTSQAGFALGWEPCRGGGAPPDIAAAGDLGLQRDTKRELVMAEFAEDVERPPLGSRTSPQRSADELDLRTAIDNLAGLVAGH